MTMLKLNEIAFLNLALDERDFFLLPSLKEIKITPLIAENIYPSLMEKGLLDQNKALTTEGADMILRLSQYKSATKYIRIGALTMGIYKADRAIIMMVDQFRQMYYFARVSTEVQMEELCKIYPFLRMENEGDALAEQTITYQELDRLVHFKINNAIFLSTFDMLEAEKDLKAATVNKILFYYEGNHYCFDHATNMLCEISQAQAQTMLKESMVLR